MWAEAGGGLTVVGGGLAGCEAALVLAERGHRVARVEMCGVRATAGPGFDVLRFAPVGSVGLREPRSGHRLRAVSQIRRDDRAGQMWNLAAFLTRLPLERREAAVSVGRAGR